MRVAVVGAGIAGVTTAYELAADGHEVAVFERRGSVAAEGSFANAGVLAYHYAAQWLSAEPRSILLGRLFGNRTALSWCPSWRAAQWRRLSQLGRGDGRAAQQRAADLHALARFSVERLQTLTAQLQLEYEQGAGYLVLLRRERELARLRTELAALRELNLSYRELDPAQCRALEPGLNPDQPLAGGIRFEQGQVANCRQFAHLLREAAERRGAEFHFGAAATLLGADAGGPMLRVEQHALSTGFAATTLAHGKDAVQVRRQVMQRRSAAAARYLDPVSEQRYDAVVLCAGAASATMLRTIGLRLPLVPVHGYSMTAPLRAPERAPCSALMDEQYKVVISRMGQRVRVAGGAEIGGHPAKHDRAAIATLYRVLGDWFPGAAHLARPQLWKGARAMLPGGLPLIGASGAPGVWLNLGHGAGGWTLSCGSARLLADLMGGHPTAVDARGYSFERYDKRQGR
ncbi:MAG TPA: FAD-dependent oxidoreductase [Methylibium sp.]